jgi:hypothetical protein
MIYENNNREIELYFKLMTSIYENENRNLVIIIP